MSNPTRHFLVTRRLGKLSEILVFSDPHLAMIAYEAQERRLASESASDCVLLGADRLSTCIATHGNWFDEPNRLLEQIETDLTNADFGV